MLYIAYPLIIISLLVLTENDLHENYVPALIVTALPVSIEVFKMSCDFREYFSAAKNLFVFSGFFSIILFFSIGQVMAYNVQ